MGTRDARVDSYIERHEAFAPILTYLRETIHEACPEVSETIKWGMPAFDYRGPICNFAAFKAHCAFTLWKAELIFAGEITPADSAMGQFGRIVTLSDLPGKAKLKQYLKKAAQLNEAGAKVPSRSVREKKPAPEIPLDLKAALAKNAQANAVFAEFTPGKQREYVEWLDEAKQAPTRAKRLAQAVEWIAEGKSRNWKYQR